MRLLLIKLSTTLDTKKLLQKIEKNKGKVITSFLLGLVVCVSGMAAYFTFGSKIFNKNQENDKAPIKATYTNPIKAEDVSKRAVLLMGYGGAGHPGGFLTDVIMLALVDKDTKKVNVISVPRDLWAERNFAEDSWHRGKINSFYAVAMDPGLYYQREEKYKGQDGAATMLKEVVEEVTGIPVSYYVAVDFNNFKNVIDALGGVEVDVPVAFDDNFYPIKGKENELCGMSPTQIQEVHKKYSGFELEKQFECRYEHLHFDKGKNKMDGETALKFVRSRHSSQHGGDFARAQRQQVVLAAIKEKLISMQALKNIDELYPSLTNLVKTDISLEELTNLAEVFGKPEEYEINHIRLTTENLLNESRSSTGQFILVPKAGLNDWSKTKEYVLENLE